MDVSLKRWTTRSMVLVAMAATTAFGLAQAFTMEPSFDGEVLHWTPVYVVQSEVVVAWGSIREVCIVW